MRLWNRLVSLFATNPLEGSQFKPVLKGLTWDLFACLSLLLLRALGLCNTQWFISRAFSQVSRAKRNNNDNNNIIIELILMEVKCHQAHIFLPFHEISVSFWLSLCLSDILASPQPEIQKVRIDSGNLRECPDKPCSPAICLPPPCTSSMQVPASRGCLSYHAHFMTQEGKQKRSGSLSGIQLNSHAVLQNWTSQNQGKVVLPEFIA